MALHTMLHNWPVRHLRSDSFTNVGLGGANMSVREKTDDHALLSLNMQFKVCLEGPYTAFSNISFVKESKINPG